MEKLSKLESISLSKLNSNKKSYPQSSKILLTYFSKVLYLNKEKNFCEKF